MTTLSLTPKQITNARIAIGAGNAVYDLNKGGAVLKVGQPLSFPTDVAGTSGGVQNGYTALPDGAPPGYVVTLVNNDKASGLNLFVAFNKETNTAIVGVAGINGVLGNAPGSAADNAQIASGFTGQMQAMFNGNGNENSGILKQLRLLSTSEGVDQSKPFSIIIGGQSGAGAAVDALTSSLKQGLTEPAAEAFGTSSENSIGFGDGLSAANVYVNKVNTVGSEYALTTLGMWGQGLKMQADGATINTIVAGDSSRNYLDLVPSLLGKQLGTMSFLDVRYPNGLPTGMGDVLVWYHRNEGAVAKFLNSGGDFSSLSVVQQNPLDTESLAAAMRVFSGITWDSNVAAYGGLAAIGMFATIFSKPGESSQALGLSMSEYFSGSANDKGFYTMMAGVLEGALKVAALTNPQSLFLNMFKLLLGSKALNSILGPNNPATNATLNPDGSVTTVWANGDSITRNDATGEYTKVLKGTDGSLTTFSSTIEKNWLTGDKVVLRYMQTDANGLVIGENIIRQSKSGDSTEYLSSIVNNGSGSVSVDTIIDSKLITLSAIRDGSNSYKITGIVAIDGAPLEPSSLTGLVNESLLNENLTSLYQLDPKGLAKLKKYVEVVDPESPNGGIQTPPGTYELPWYKDPTVVATLTDISSLLAALKSGRPLPIANSVFGIASHNFPNNVELGNIASGVSVISNLKSLADALERGNVAQVAVSSGSLVSTALQLQQTALRFQFAAAPLGSAAETSLRNQIVENDALLKSLGKGIAILNLLIAIDKQDLNSAIISAAYFIPVYGPLISSVLAIADMVLGPQFGGNQSFESEGQFVGLEGGQISLAIGNHNGGANGPWTDWMNLILRQTRESASARQSLTGIPMGVIAERLPHLSFKEGVAMLWYTDVKTGIEYSRTFDLQGNYLAPGYIEDIGVASPWGANPANQFAREGRNVNPADKTANNQIALSPDFFKNIFQQVSDAVTASGAVAPMWEVATFDKQRSLQSGLWDDAKSAGLTPQQLAKKSNQLDSWDQGDARPGNGIGAGQYSTRTFSPIVLDLDHNGSISTTDSYYGPGILFDVDDDGYAEETQWVGPRDGILVLDRNGDGQIDVGTDLFNDKFVDNASRGLDVLRQIDADVDGTYYQYYGSHLNADDPVFRHLQVWMDVNGDGVAQKYELLSLAELKITSIDVEAYWSGDTGTFVQDGATQLMQSVDLGAKVAGVVTTKLGNSLLVQQETGEESLLALAAFDFGSNAQTSVGHIHTSEALRGTDELLDGQEDLSIVVSVEQLLKNDTSSAGAVTFAGLVQVRNGTAVFDAEARTITFTPNADFNSTSGQSAGFDYTVRDAANNVVQASTVIDVGTVDDAAVAVLSTGTRRATWADMTSTRADRYSVTTYSVPGLAAGELRSTTTQSSQIVSLGYLSEMGRQTGALGFADGKMFYAPFAALDNVYSQQAWKC